MNGWQVGASAMQVLGDRQWDSETGPNLLQACEAINHMQATKEQLWEAVAYLALQANTYRAMSGEDAHLALVQIEHILVGYRLRVKS